MAIITLLTLVVLFSRKIYAYLAEQHQFMTDKTVKLQRSLNIALIFQVTITRTDGCDCIVILGNNSSHNWSSTYIY